MNSARVKGLIQSILFENLTGTVLLLALSPFLAKERMSLLGIPAVRQAWGGGSAIMAFHIPVNNGHELVGISQRADAICERMFHSSNRLERQGFFR
jgi:hypothetical protein